MENRKINNSDYEVPGDKPQEAMSAVKYTLPARMEVTQPYEGPQQGWHPLAKSLL
jgi:hypothetical protein